MNQDISLRTVRGLLAALIITAAAVGWLLNDLAAGEPTRGRAALLGLLTLAWVGGRIHEGLRRGDER